MVTGPKAEFARLNDRAVQGLLTERELQRWQTLKTEVVERDFEGAERRDRPRFGARFPVRLIQSTHSCAAVTRTFSGRVIELECGAPLERDAVVHVMLEIPQFTLAARASVVCVDERACKWVIRLEGVLETDVVRLEACAIEQRLRAASVVGG